MVPDQESVVGVVAYIIQAFWQVIKLVCGLTVMIVMEYNTFAIR